MPSPRKTFADYIAIAICPLLIMVLVGSLAFFLLEIGYHGAHEGRLRWALFWFVIAIVLVSRISIEQSAERAGAYGLLLAGATAMLIMRLTGPNIVAWSLLGFIWWGTGKLTWDCTLIEDSDDASGEGLLQAGGLEKTAEPSTDAKGRKRRRIYWWQRLFLSHQNTTGQPHSPGLWIVYFSLFALPAFGFGQLLIRNAAERQYGFVLLCLYVAAAMALLMLTSFLGLRRYLRQRFLHMPATVSLTWVIMGTCLIAAILAACLLIPRPNARYSITTLVEQAAEAAKKEASKYAALGGESGEGEGRRIGTGEGEGKGEPKEDSKAKGEQGEEKGESPKDKSKDGDQGEKGKEKSDQEGKQGEEKKDAKGEKSKDKGDTPQPEQRSADWIGTLVKWLIYGLIALALLYLLFRFRKQIAEFLRALWAEILNFFRSLFHREPKPEAAAPAPQIRIVRRPFSTFHNPFRTGEDMPPAELVTYTFDALQAWAAEQGIPRPPDQTPLEFSRQIAAHSPDLADDARELARHYTRFAYAETEPGPDAVPALQRLWNSMTAPKVTA
ncbi:MAG: DUF4129 domain-containing protein [Verrucomicrobiota bacterium]